VAQLELKVCRAPLAKLAHRELLVSKVRKDSKDLRGYLDHKEKLVLRVQLEQQDM